MNIGPPTGPVSDGVGKHVKDSAVERPASALRDALEGLRQLLARLEGLLGSDRTGDDMPEQPYPGMYRGG